MRIRYLRAVVALGGDERAAMVWERCSPKLWLLLGDTWKRADIRVSMRTQMEKRLLGHGGLLTVFPVKVTGGDCQEMLKLELLVGVKLVEPLLLLDGMDTGAVA